MAIAAKTNDGGNVVKAIEKAVGCEIDETRCPFGRNPTDGPGADDGVEGVVGQAVAVFGFVAVNRVGHVGVLLKGSIIKLRKCLWGEAQIVYNRMQRDARSCMAPRKF